MSGIFFLLDEPPPDVPPPIVSGDVADLSQELKLFSTRRGRSTNLDRIEAGIAQWLFNNGDGSLDPANPNSPYFPNVLPLKGIQLTRRVDGITYYRHAGRIERYEPERDGPNFQRMRIESSDSFEQLANIQIVSDIATLTTTLTGANNDLIFTANEAGGRGDDITVTYVVAGLNTPLAVESQSPLGTEILGSLIGKIALPSLTAGAIEKAFAITRGGLGGLKPGSATVPNVPMTISLSGTDIVVNVATNGAGAATSTAAQIKTALEANEDVMALVTITNAPGNDGSGVVTAMSKTNLSGGKWAQELTGARITRVLDLIGWPVDYRVVDDGTLEVIAQGFGESENVSALTHMQDVADSELGYIFIAGNGTFHYHDGGHRSREERSTISQATFSDDGTGYPFVDIAVSLDKEKIANEVIVTAGHAAAVPQVVSDVDSQAVYGVRTYSKQTLLAADEDALAVATSIGAAYADPKTRFERVTVLDDGSTEGWDPAVLGREIGDLVTVRTSPPVAEGETGYTITYDCYIESIEDSRGPGLPWQVTFGLTLAAESVSTDPPDPPDPPAGGGGALLDSSGDEFILDDAAAGVLG